MSPDTNTTPAPDVSQVPPPPKSSKWRQIALGVFILFCGMVIGAGGMVLIAPQRLAPQFMQPGRMTHFMAERMRDELNLTPEQEKQVRSIVTRHMEAINAIRDEERPKIEQQVTAMREEVAKVLDPEQAQRWNQRFEQMQHMRPPGFPGGHFRGGPGAPPGGGFGDHPGGFGGPGGPPDQTGPPPPPGGPGGPPAPNSPPPGG